VRRRGGVALLLIAAVLFPVGVAAIWARETLYDSTTFSDRTVEILDSSTVREVLAQRLTEQLARSGNTQAVNFRPGLQLAIEAVVQTDAFRSIFRTAVRRTHAAILAGKGGSVGLDLEDSVAIITSSLQASQPAAADATSSGSLGGSLSDVTDRLGSLGVWRLDNTISTVGTVAILAALVAAAGAIALAEHRRRMVRRIGWVLVVDGAVLVAALQIAQWWARHSIADPQLAGAVGDALFHATSDLRTAGWWVVAYGLVVVAASGTGVRYAPAVVAERLGAWVQRRRATTGGTVLLGALAIAAGGLLVQDPSGNAELLVVGVGLWLGYLGVTELLRLVQTAPAAAPRSRRRSRVLLGGATAVLLAVVTSGLVLTTSSAARRADAAGELPCNGEASLCDLRIDQVMFPGTHNSMSSSLYAGFLFGEQLDTIKGQLDSGIRALLIDTHYGIPSTLRLPGSNTPMVLTDRAAELRQPGGEAADPAVAERAARLAARAPKAANARRGIYLCHNYCELGAVPFSNALGEVKQFLDTHPDDVVITIIQDATTPAETAAAIEAAGLGDRVATLHTGEPLPTLGQLIDEHRTLIVLAEQGGSGAPAWYEPAYKWFQETPYDFSKPSQFNCRPNRGAPTNPLFLVNHWITGNSPDPSGAARVNSAADLRDRIEKCIAQRGLLPNIVAVNFSEKGSLVSTLRAINTAQLAHVHKRAGDAAAGAGAPTPTPTTTAPRPVITTGASTVPPPKSTVVTTLTGGDPQRLCPTVPVMLRHVVAWAQDILGQDRADAGVTDLLYGPLLTRSVGAYVDVAPVELADLARPLLVRAQAAVSSLRVLGLDDAAIEALADEASSALEGQGTPDGITTATRLRAHLERSVRPERLDSTALVFETGQPDPATVLDLGYVPSGVGPAAGFDCPSISASI
jgi:hypothetical protein